MTELLTLSTLELNRRLRRNRKSAAIRALVQETHLTAQDLVHPFFVIEGEHERQPIESMPGICRLSVDEIIKEAESFHRQGVPAIALFPLVPLDKRSPLADEALNPEGLIPRAVRAIKRELPSLCVITDVALDPYTSHGHDGITTPNHEIDNDGTVAILCEQALIQAEAGVDIVAPSDMMDGRVKAIRQALDRAGHQNVTILSYAIKYASALYSPFRGAIQTKLAFGDKKTYQMNPANSREALLEALVDESEGADMLMIKPATLYLDVLNKLRAATNLPLAAFHVSGEYAMVKAASHLLSTSEVFYESLLSIKRAGADFILTYATKEVLPYLKG